MRPSLFQRNFLRFALLIVLGEIHAEWGGEASVGANPTAYYNEEIQKQQSNFRTQISGTRHALSFTGKIHYEWIGARFWFDNYFGATGKQKTQSNVQGPGNSSSYQSVENEGVDFSAVRNWRGELQLRKFYYGHREYLSLNIGLMYRKVATSLTGQPADYVATSFVQRYATVGVSWEPLITNFGRFELSLPIDFSVALKFPEGGIFASGAGPGGVFFGAGARLQFEPRGAFLTTQGVVNFHDTPYTANGATYSFSQVEIALRIMVGYYFRTPVYNE